MTVIEKNPVPIYEAVCEECKSKIQYRKVEVHFTGYITCPVCGMGVWAPTLVPVRMETEHDD